jgi:ApbE superfamily uncharacterized protein (UPF0280 family)
MYQERTYRSLIAVDDLVSSRVWVGQSDLFILANQDVTEPGRGFLLEVRNDLESYIRRDPSFLTSRVAHSPLHNAPWIVMRMAEVSAYYNIGPMAAVAGAVADCVGQQLMQSQTDVIIENGGDIFVDTRKPIVFTLYAGENSPFSGKLKFKPKLSGSSFGVCTSSGTVGHSYSQGRADAVCVVSQTASQADAAATAMGNKVKRTKDIGLVIQEASNNHNILGIIVALEDKLGIWGQVEII